jgi:hypothetical protein
MSADDGITEDLLKAMTAMADRIMLVATATATI